jgi:glycogen operon protein
MSCDPAARSRAHPLGLRLRDGGAEVAVLAAHADGVWFCVLDPAERGGWIERQVELTSRTHGVWHGFVPGVGVGTRYGYRRRRALGARARATATTPPSCSSIPYARALDGRLHLRPEAFGHVVDERFAGDPTSGTAATRRPSCRTASVTGRPFDWAGDAPPDVPLADTVLYEAHVKGFTRRLPGVPERLRGTYAGLGHPGGIEHLLRLGVTDGRAAADPGDRRRDRGSSPAAAELLGLQHPELLRAPSRATRPRRTRSTSSTRSRAWSGRCTPAASR